MRPLPKLKPTPGESRETILDHEEPQHVARLVRVETGGVDRNTGAAASVYYEVGAKHRGTPEQTRTFTGQGDPDKAEWNARQAYDMAQRGISDFSTTLGDLPVRVWDAPKNLKRLGDLREHYGWPETLPHAREWADWHSGARMSRAYSEPDCPFGAERALPDDSDRIAA